MKIALCPLRRKWTYVTNIQGPLTRLKSQRVIGRKLKDGKLIFFFFFLRGLDFRTVVESGTEVPIGNNQSRQSINSLRGVFFPGGEYSWRNIHVGW